MRKSFTQLVDPAAYYSAVCSGRKNKTTTNAGWTDGGLCHFHSDSEAGSYRVNVKTGAYICYACGAKGPSPVHHHASLYSLTHTRAAIDLAKTYL